jgi:hypothetical protein
MWKTGINDMKHEFNLTNVYVSIQLAFQKNIFIIETKKMVQFTEIIDLNLSNFMESWSLHCRQIRCSSFIN